MKTLVALLLFIAILSIESIAQLRPRGAWPFSAPSVSDPTVIDKVAGDIAFNTTLNAFVGWNGASWMNFTPGSFLYNISSVKTANYSTVATDNVILVNANIGAFYITLYDATSNPGGTIVIKKEGSDLNAVTLNTTSSQTIDGIAGGSYDLYTPNEAITLISDGSNWQIISHQNISGWTSFTPTGSWSTNTTYTGRWRRVGDSGEYEVQVALSGAPTSATLTINLPSGHVIDTSKILATNADKPLGISKGFNHLQGGYGGITRYVSSTSVAPQLFSNPSTTVVTTGDVSQSTPWTMANTDYIWLTFTVPIVGWQP